MFKITTLFVIFACLTTAFALNATLTKNFFFVNSYNKLSYKLFHTSNGIIAYNLESSPNGPIPQYLLLDPISGSAAPILTDLLSSCGQVGGVVFDRLYYHVQTSALVYFCTANNSLLILDERTYAVHDAIPTGISENFAEAKLTTDGNDIYVLLMGPLYQTNNTASQLAEINVPARAVTRKIVFKEGFGDQEFVNGFVSQGQEAFALTNQVDGFLTTVTIYALNLTGNTYEPVQLTNFSYSTSPNYLSQLFLFGDFLVTNSIGNLYFLNKQGQTVDTYILGSSKTFDVETGVQVPAIVAQEGSCFLYVQFYQEVLAKFTAQGDTILYETVDTVFDFQIAYGTRYTSDLLLSIDVSQQNFTITTLENSEIVYKAQTSYENFVITNSTYGIVKLGIIDVYNRRSNALIGSVSLPASFQLHYDSDTLYFSKTEDGYTSCIIMQLDLTTLNVQAVLEYHDMKICQGAISQFKLSNLGYPEFVVSTVDQDFLIVSSTYGIVNFDLEMFSNEAGLVIPNFETMTFYQLQSDPSANTTQVSYYEYNENSTTGNNFNLKDSYDIAGSALSFYSAGNQKVIAIYSGYFTVIDLEYGSTTDYSFPTNSKSVSSFEDSAGRKHIIFSDLRTAGDWEGTVTQPSLFDMNGVSQLPGTNSFTVQAGAAGECSYWVVDGYLSSVGQVKFYDACAKEGMSSISL